MNSTIQDKIFLAFMALRFPNIIETENYWQEWKGRFDAGTEWTCADSKSKAVLAGLCNLYEIETKNLGICNYSGCAKKATKKIGSLAYCTKHAQKKRL